MSGLLFALLFGTGLFLLADGLTAQRHRAPTRRRARGWAGRSRVQQFLDRAGLWHVRPWEFLVASGVAGVLGGVLTSLVLHWPVLALCAVVAGALVPTMVVAHLADQRLAAQQAALPDALGQLRDMLNGGLSIQLGLRSLEDDGPAALQPELARITRDVATTGSFSLALAASRERVAEPLWDLVTATLVLQDRKGADNLSAAFDELSRSARAQLGVYQELQAYRVRTEWTARLLTSLPLGLLIVGRVSAPSYFVVFDDPQGQLWLGLCVALIGLAYGLMRWIGRPPADPRVLVAG